MNPVLLASLAFLIPVLPLLVACGLPFARTQGLALKLAAWVPVTGLLLLPLHGNVIEFPWLLLGARVGLDDTTLPFLLLASVVWTVAGLHARHYLHDDRQHLFFLFWLLTWTGNLCVFITLDMASFYAAYAMMTFAAYGLIVFNGQRADYHAGRVYLVMAILGEALILAALLTLGSQLGNLSLEANQPGVEQLRGAPWVMWCLIAGFGIKTGLIGLHMWLPLAHPRAPVPASAILSGVILKAGLVGLLRFLPLEHSGFELAGMVLVVAGMVTAFFGVLLGLTQVRAKSLLAYSSVSQMGLITVAIGLALIKPDTAPFLIAVVGIFALHHGLAKAMLFLAVDIAQHTPGMARTLMWWPALALAGAPATSGALAKAALKSGASAGPTGLETALLLSSVATTLLMARFLWLTWPRNSQEADAPDGHLPWMFGVVAVMTLPWILASITEPESTLRPFRPDYLVDTSLPVLVGMVAAILGGRFMIHRRYPAIPEGDLLFLIPRFSLPKLPKVSMGIPEGIQRTASTSLNAIDRHLIRLTPALLIGIGLLTILFSLLR